MSLEGIGNFFRTEITPPLNRSKNVGEILMLTGGLWTKTELKERQTLPRELLLLLVFYLRGENGNCLLAKCERFFYKNVINPLKKVN